MAYTTIRQEMKAEKVVGLALLALAALSTAVNESRLARRALSLEEARGLALPLAAPAALAGHDGRLVVFSGRLQASTAANSDVNEARESPIVMDAAFGVAVRGVRLHRCVEMLQWVETAHRSTGSTPEDEDRAGDAAEVTYIYDLRWREEAIDSAGFDDASHWNPPEDAWQYRSLVVKVSLLSAQELTRALELTCCAVPKCRLKTSSSVTLPSLTRWWTKFSARTL